ncbi:hypothetical protein G6F15_003898 [Rhizopus arrhizus]|nr:hypothetical protein G6F15_003898 [Rhizopus arrhizus]KAG0996520.1 hypothetical protein G6F28_003776 [Rhizopus arrhizus]KAG1041134.1 hypothetical protein G6F25_004216 [Rhizopus arrhizus]KAG1191132.1 hypothetical protein G6F36_002572 [Rhizopus arrhizus]
MQQHRDSLQGEREFRGREMKVALELVRHRECNLKTVALDLAQKARTPVTGEKRLDVALLSSTSIWTSSNKFRMYVSPSSCSKSPIAARDMTTDKDYTDISGCVGNTQSSLMCLSSTTKKICLVIVGYAALSTDPDDILLLVKNYKSLEYIIVDRFQDVGKYEVYRRNDILKTPEQLASFDCRPKLPHRSI